MNIINIEHISKIFGEKVIYEDASFGVQQGDRIGIVGINGTGKSTLLRMIAGDEVPDEGQIIRQNGLKIAWVPQNLAGGSQPAGIGHHAVWAEDETPVRRTEAQGGSGENPGRGF